MPGRLHIRNLDLRLMPRLNRRWRCDTLNLKYIIASVFLIFASSSKLIRKVDVNLLYSPKFESILIGLVANPK